MKYSESEDSIETEYNVQYSSMQHLFNDENPLLSDDQDEFFMIKFYDQVDNVSDNKKESENEFDYKKQKKYLEKSLYKRTIKLVQLVVLNTIPKMNSPIN